MYSSSKMQNRNECIVCWIYPVTKPKHGTEFIICGRLCDLVLATHLNKNRNDVANLPKPARLFCQLGHLIYQPNVQFLTNVRIP